MELNHYLIDISKAVSEEGEPGQYGPPRVQMITYAVLAPTAEEAMRRFTEEQAGEIVYEGPLVEGTIIGIQQINV